MSVTFRAGILLAVAATSGLLFTNFSNIQPVGTSVSPVIHEAFQKWSLENKRLYGTPSELNYRLSVFAENYAEVERLKSKVSHEVGLTIFADLTKEEFMTKYNGFNGSPAHKSKRAESIAQKFVKSMPEVTAPSTFDHREDGISTPVKNQKGCGSCWAFSAIASFEGAYIKAGNPSTTFSEQQLVDCARSYGNNGCQGGWMSRAFDYLEENGSMISADYPYVARDETCLADGEKMIARVVDYVDLPANDPKALKNAAAENIVSVAVEAQSWMTYKSGIIRKDGGCGSKLSHGVVVVGYGIEDGVKHWIIKNSWGSLWGESGYVRVEDTEETGPGVCGINLVNSYAETIEKL